MSSIEHDFGLGDIVVQNWQEERPLLVTGYITNQQRLFVRDMLNRGKEFEIHFSEVTDHWIKEVQG